MALTGEHTHAAAAAAAMSPRTSPPHRAAARILHSEYACHLSVVSMPSPCPYLLTYHPPRPMPPHAHASQVQPFFRFQSRTNVRASFI